MRNAADEFEEEYYPTTQSPFAPVDARAEFSVAHGFPGPDEPTLAGDVLGDEIISEADWTADQLGDNPWPTPAESVPGDRPHADAAEPEEGAERGDGDGSAAEREAGAASADGRGTGGAWAGERSADKRGADERGAAASWADNQAEVWADEQRSDVWAAEQGSDDEVGAVEVTAQFAAIGVDGDAAEVDRAHAPGPAEQAEERLVVPAPSGGMVIPGLGLVGGGGPRVEPEPGSIEEAMRSEVERPRPRPKESAAFRALREWCLARTRIVPSGFTIQVQVLDRSAPSYRFDLEPPRVDDPEYPDELISELLGELWLTEAQSEQGGWLFARIDAAGRTVRIDRWYDQVPDWWDNPLPPQLDFEGLVRRLYRRGPDWQPSYLQRLYTTAR